MHSLNFKCVIDTLCKEGKILRYCRPEFDFYLEMDASGVAIGMALFQSKENER